MNAKLTLSLSGSMVRKGKLAAQARDTSLSDLVSRFIESLEVNPPKEQMLDPRVSAMYGAYKLPSGYELDSLRFDSLVKKHLK